MASNAMTNRFLEIPTSAFIFSVMIHLLVPFSIVTLKVMDGLGFKIFPEKKIIKDAYQSFIQVDVVALPDQLGNEKMDFDASLPAVEKPQMEVEPAKTEAKDDIMLESEQKDAKLKEAKEKEEMALKKEKEKAEKKRLADQEKIMKKLEEDARRDQALKSLQSKSGQKGRGKLKGNVLSQGTASKGMIGSAKDQYTAILTESIKRHFNIYLWQQKKNLLAEIEFELFPTGRIRKKRIVKGSSDPTFDSAILKAIDDAQPMPLPEDPTLMSEEFHITFKP